MRNRKEKEKEERKPLCIKVVHNKDKFNKHLIETLKEEDSKDFPKIA